MSKRGELEAALWRILDTLRGYSDELLLIGGWVPYLHLTYGRAAEEGAQTSLTAEADLVVPEFFQPHRGPAARLGRIRPVDEQPGLQALSLDHLWVLETFADFVPVPAPDDGGRPAPVRVPSWVHSC